MASSDRRLRVDLSTTQRHRQHYTNQALKELGINADMDWHQAAMNPRVASRMAADYDKDLLKGTGGDFAKALSQNNAGPHGWDYTGHPGQGRDYGMGINQAGITLQVQLAGSVDITQNGQKVGSAQAGQHIRATATHSIDTSKKHVGAQSYGPDQRPPSPGLPNLTGHIK